MKEELIENSNISKENVSEELGSSESFGENVSLEDVVMMSNQTISNLESAEQELKVVADYTEGEVTNLGGQMSEIQSVLDDALKDVSFYVSGAKENILNILRASAVAGALMTFPSEAPAQDFEKIEKDVKKSELVEAGIEKEKKKGEGEKEEEKEGVGEKKLEPMIVESKDDPRYIEYQDSLRMHNASVDLFNLTQDSRYFEEVYQNPGWMDFRRGGLDGNGKVIAPSEVVEKYKELKDYLSNAPDHMWPLNKENHEGCKSCISGHEHKNRFADMNDTPTGSAIAFSASDVAYYKKPVQEVKVLNEKYQPIWYGAAGHKSEIIGYKKHDEDSGKWIYYYSESEMKPSNGHSISEIENDLYQ